MGGTRVRREFDATHGEVVEDNVAEAPATVQRSARLTVGAVDDRAEREADDVARATVAALARPAPAGAADRHHGQRVHRRAVPVADSSDRTPVARRVERSPIGAAGGAVDADTDARIRRATGGGRPLDPGLARQMSTAMGADLSHVRVHAGAESRVLNDRIQAQAFTVGNDIHFRDGLPDTSSTTGRHLLAHEVAHTLQHGQSARRTIRRVPARVLQPTELRKPHDTDVDKIDDTDTGVSRVTAQPGETLDVDPAITRTDSQSPETMYVQTVKVGSKKLKRYVRKSSIEIIGSRGTGKGPESSWDRTEKTSGKIGGIVSVLPDINDAQDGFKTRGNSIDANMESGVGIAAGAGDTAAMITGLASAISAFNQQGANGSDKAGAILNGVSSLGSGAKGVSGIVDKSGAGGKEATAGAQGVAGFVDAFAGIKDTFFAIKHIVELVQEADKLNDKEKFSKSMEIITEAMSAAKSGVSSAKAFMELWGGGAGAPLVDAVPGFGIALSCVDIIIRAVDLVESQIHRHRMQTMKRTSKEALGGTKGTTLKGAAQTFVKSIDDRREAGETISDADQLKYEQYTDYLTAKGLQYIAQKRTNRAILKISVAMGKIAGDAAVLGGASAPVGIGIKGGAMALDVGASAFRRFKQWGRDKAAATGATTGFFSLFNQKKSTAAKLEGYNKMVDKVFDMIVKTAALTTGPIRTKAEEQLAAFVGAMGMSLKQMNAMKGDPLELRTSMIMAMQKRE